MPRKHSARPPSKQGDKELPSGSQSPIGWLSRAALARAALPALTSQFLTREASEFAALKPVPEQGRGGAASQMGALPPLRRSPPSCCFGSRGPWLSRSGGRRDVGGTWQNPPAWWPLSLLFD